MPPSPRAPPGSAAFLHWPPAVSVLTPPPASSSVAHKELRARGSVPRPHTLAEPRARRHSQNRRTELPVPHTPTPRMGQSALPESSTPGGPEVARQLLSQRQEEKAPCSAIRTLDPEQEQGTPVPSNNPRAIARERRGPVRTTLLCHPGQVTQPLRGPPPGQKVRYRGGRCGARAGAPEWGSRRL